MRRDLPLRLLLEYDDEEKEDDENEELNRLLLELPLDEELYDDLELPLLLLDVLIDLPLRRLPSFFFFVLPLLSVSDSFFFSVFRFSSLSLALSFFLSSFSIFCFFSSRLAS